jgi:hypothetical protein
MNKCPICNAQIASTLLLCKTHWDRVPRELREKVWKLYRAAPGSSSHQKACLEAIASVYNGMDFSELE